MARSLFNEIEPTHTYTSDEAIADGVLTEPYPDKFPGWIITTGVHEAIAAKAGDGRSYDQMLIPLLMDAQLITIAKRDHLHTRGLEGNVTGEAIWIGVNEKGGYTLMFPSEY